MYSEVMTVILAITLSVLVGLLIARNILTRSTARVAQRRILRAAQNRMLNAQSRVETAESLVREAKDGLTAGASVQILIRGYPTWLAITALWSQGEQLLHVTLTDESGILIGKDSIISVRFGEIDDSD